jgi:hypothetical protein
MPLSEHEQRILDEIERRLASEDPKFARDVSAVTPYGQAVRRLKRAVGGFVVGFALLVTALFVNIWLGVGAFAVMLWSAVVIASSAKHAGRERGRSSESEESSGWFARLEERWRKRFERGES